MPITLPKGFTLISEFIAGSNLYGTNTPDSDLDIRGVFIPTIEYFLGFAQRTKGHSDKIYDIEYHELRHFFKLALKCNPNIIEYFLSPPRKNVKIIQRMGNNS